MTFARFAFWVVTIGVVCYLLNTLMRWTLERQPEPEPTATQSITETMSSRSEMMRALRTAGAEGW